MAIVLAIVTDGPRLGDVTITEIQAASAAHDQALMAQGVLTMVAIVLLIGLSMVLPRLWRRAAKLSAGASGSNG